MSQKAPAQLKILISLLEDTRRTLKNAQLESTQWVSPNAQTYRAHLIGLETDTVFYCQKLRELELKISALFREIRR